MPLILRAQEAGDSEQFNCFSILKNCLLWSLIKRPLIVQFKIIFSGEKTKTNDRSGFCPNVTFEDDEFKEDNKALNDQGEGEGTKSF